MRIFSLLLLSFNLNAAPIDVTFFNTGSSGNWLQHISVTSHLGGSNTIYMFGVQAPSPENRVSAPTGWVEHIATDWWNGHITGANNETYFNIWNVSNIGWGIHNEQTINYFVVKHLTTIAPDTVKWFAFARDGVYTAGDNFNGNYNPGFDGSTYIPQRGGEDIIGRNDLPEPGTLLLSLLGVYFVRRFSNS